MLLHEGADILMISINTTIRKPKLHTISHLEVSIHSIVLIPTRKSGISISTMVWVSKLQTNETLITQNPQ